MAITQLYTAIAGDVITAARWNNEFGNIYNNFGTLPVQGMPNMKDNYSAVGDGITDDTAAYLTAVTAGGDIFVPAGTYIISAVSITASTKFVCEPGVVFKRKASTDTASGSYTSATAAMFYSAATAGLTIAFVGDWTYDGNKANQTATEPTGFFLRVYDHGISQALPTVVRLENGYFKNGTSGYVVIKGDDSAKAYRTLVYILNCRFTDTIVGKGLGDPATPTALGYLPSYLFMYNYVDLYCLNFHATFDQTSLTLGTSSDTYAPSALFGSYSGVAADAGVSAYYHGTTFLKGMGRAGRKYNDVTNYSFNNGIGAIDCYGNAATLYVENVVGESNQNVTIRAKASLKTFIVLSANLSSCHRGLQCGPSTTGAAETDVYYGNVTCVNGTTPQVECAGTTSVDRVRTCRVDHMSISGTITDPENILAGSPNDGVAHFENTEYVSIGHARVLNSPVCGMDFDDCDVVDAHNVIIKTAAGARGIGFTACVVGSVSNFLIDGVAGPGIGTITATTKVTLKDGTITNCANYGVFGNETTSTIMCDNITLGTITTLDRGFYKAGGGVLIIRDCTAPTVATPILFAAGANVQFSKGAAVSADKGNAAATLNIFSSERTSVWATPLTADRAVTLATTNVSNGGTLRIVRTAAATGAFNLNVGTGPLKALVAGTWCEVEYNGTAWFLSQYGAL